MPEQNTEGQERVGKKSRDRLVSQIEGINVEKSWEFLKSLVFLFPSIKQSEDILYKHTTDNVYPPPKKRYLGINLTKYLHDLYGENCKTL